MDTSNLIIILALIFFLSCMSTVCVLFAGAYIYKEYVEVKTLTADQSALAANASKDIKLTYE